MTMNPSYTYKAKCKEVIDGDTIVLEYVDLGFNIFLTDIRIRFNRINAPESRTLDLTEKELGLRSKEYLKERLTDKDIVIETYKDRQHDDFGRYLAEVLLEGVNINDELVKLGYAKLKTYK